MIILYCDRFSYFTKSGMRMVKKGENYLLCYFLSSKQTTITTNYQELATITRNYPHLKKGAKEDRKKNSDGERIQIKKAI